MEVKELVKFLETHGFLQSFGAINGTHIYINRKGYHSINMQVICDYRHCFLDALVKWSGSVHDSRIFLNSSINKKLKNGEIPTCEKVLEERKDAIPVCWIGDIAYPWLTFLMNEYPVGAKKQKEKYFGYKLSSARIIIENARGRLKARFRCLHCAMDIDINILPQVIHSCFILHNYWEIKNGCPRKTFYHH